MGQDLQITNQYLYDKEDTALTLRDNLIKQFHWDLRKDGHLEAFEFVGGNTIKLAKKPLEIEIFVNTTRDRATALRLDEINRGFRVNRQNKYGQQQTYRNYYFWTQGQLSDLTTDAEIIVEISGVGVEVDYFLSNNSQLSLIADQFKIVADSLSDFKKTFKEQLEETRRLNKMNGYITEEDIKNITIDYSKNATRLLTPSQVSKNNYSFNTIKGFKAQHKGANIYDVANSIGQTLTACLRVESDKNALATISLNIITPAPLGFSGGGGRGITTAPTLCEATCLYAIVDKNNEKDDSSYLYPLNQHLLRGNQVIGYKNGGAEWCVNISAQNVPLVENKATIISLMAFPVEVETAGGQEWGAWISVMKNEGGWSGNLVVNGQCEITKIIEEYQPPIIPEIEELPPIEIKPIEPNINKIILTMQRTAETTDNAIGATAFKFIDTDNNLFEAEPNISGNSGTLTFIHNSEYFTGNVTLNLADKSDEYNKNYIFQEIEGKSWISQSVAAGQKVKLIIDFGEEGAPNIFSGIQLLNGKAILGAEGQENIESWFQKANLLIIDENSKIIVNQDYEFGNIGMTLEAEIPPINPEPEPEPEPEINNIHTFRYKAVCGAMGSTATTGYIALGEYRLIDKEGNKLIPMINAKYNYSTNPFTLEYKGKQYSGEVKRYNLEDYNNSGNYNINRITADISPNCGTTGGWASKLTNKNNTYNIDLIFTGGTPKDIIGFELIPFRSQVGYNCTYSSGDLQLLDEQGEILDKTTIPATNAQVKPYKVLLGQQDETTN